MFGLVIITFIVPSRGDVGTFTDHLDPVKISFSSYQFVKLKCAYVTTALKCVL